MTEADPAELAKKATDKADNVVSFLREQQRTLKDPKERLLAKNAEEATIRFTKDPKNKELLGYYLGILQDRKEIEVGLKKGDLEEVKKLEKKMQEGITAIAGKDALGVLVGAEVKTGDDVKKKAALAIAVGGAKALKETGVAVTKATGVYLTAQTQMAGLMAIAPAALPVMLFPKQKELMGNWLGELKKAMLPQEVIDGFGKKAQDAMNDLLKPLQTPVQPPASKREKGGR